MEQETPGAAIGRRVRRMRDHGLWTRSELAERTGLSRQAIANLELGTSDRPRRGTIEKLAGALGVDIETLLEGMDGAEGAADDAPLGTVQPAPDIRAESDVALRYWMAYLERRLAAHDLTKDEWLFAQSAAIAFGQERVMQLPGEGFYRFMAVLKALNDEAEGSVNFEAELRALEAGEHPGEPTRNRLHTETR
jgi:transcriptional regulator with XRE-family HTH domain